MDAKAKTSASPEIASILKQARESDPDILGSPFPFIRTPVEYRDGDKELHGVAVYQDTRDDQGQKHKQRPGILVVHTAVGLEEDFMEWKLQAFASLGFVAFGVDMYGEGRALWSREESLAARAPLTEDRSRMAQRMFCAYSALQKLETVDSTTIAAAGYCFGGMAVLDLARSQLASDLKATIAFHGILDAPPLPAPQGCQPGVSGSLLICHGEADPFVPPESVNAFLQDMEERKAEVTFLSFPGVKHSFTRPEKTTAADEASGLLYDEDAARGSWKAAKEVLQGLL